jgi:hypothetical protein
VELYGRVRRAVCVEGKGQRAVVQEFGVARETVPANDVFYHTVAVEKQVSSRDE